MTYLAEELKTTVHYKNRSGTSVSCADCHVASSKHPLDYARKATMKVLAARDVIGHLRGTIVTPEKYEAKRAELAQHVWDGMKANDSRECRNCHGYDAMDFHKQNPRAREKMEPAAQKGETCIDCHKGVAHRLPPRDD